jgi:hypothetical protein
LVKLRAHQGYDDRLCGHSGVDLPAQQKQRFWRQRWKNLGQPAQVVEVFL